jgi:hypothetical protein
MNPNPSDQPEPIPRSIQNFRPDFTKIPHTVTVEIRVETADGLRREISAESRDRGGVVKLRQLRDQVERGELRSPIDGAPVLTDLSQYADLDGDTTDAAVAFIVKPDVPIPLD